MTTKEQLSAMIKTYGLESVIVWMHDICREESEFLSTIAEDQIRAMRWEKTANCLLNAYKEAERE